MTQKGAFQFLGSFFVLILAIISLTIPKATLSPKKIANEGGNMKRALIMHGWGAKPENHWFFQERDLLQQMGYKVFVPELPSNHSPTEKEWVNVIKGFAPDGQSVLIGHSLGGTTIIEYLETAETKVGAVVLVDSPVEFTEELKKDKISGFKLYLQSVATSAFLKMCDYDEIYDWPKIKNMSDKFILIYKTDDLRAPKIQGEFLREKLGGQLTLVEGSDHGHLFDLDIINTSLKEAVLR